MSLTESNQKPVRWQYLLTGALSMLFAGIIYAWSILKTPFAEFGWSASQLALNFTLTMCFFVIGGIVSGILTRKTSPKVTGIASAVLVCLGFNMVSRISGQNILMLYISYGVLCGLGIGMAYNVFISVANAWFPDEKGTCSGILMMSFGASTLVLGNVAAYLFRAENIGWKTTYVILGIVIGGILLISSFFLKIPPADIKFPQPKATKKSSRQEDFEKKDYTTLQMLGRFTFWKFFLYTISLAAVGSTVISFAKDLAIFIGAAESFATSLVGILSICNGLGRIICGVMFDTAGLRRTMIFANIITIAAPTVLLLSIFTDLLLLGVIGFCLVGLSYGCAPTISSTFVSSFYGSKYFSINFSVVNTTLIPASFTATLAGSLVAATGSYTTPVVLLIALSVFSLLLNLSIKRP